MRMLQTHLQTLPWQLVAGTDGLAELFSEQRTGCILYTTAEGFRHKQRKKSTGDYTEADLEGFEGVMKVLVLG